MTKFLIATLLVCASFSTFANNADSASFYVKKAIELNKSRKVWEADKNFQKALQFNPDDMTVRLEYGNYLLEQRKYTQAVEQFAKVLQADLNNVAALTKMTELNFQLHRWNDAVMYGGKLLQTNSSADVKYMLGKSYYELENYGQSQKFLKEALDANPKNLPAVTLLGKVLIELSDYKQAISVYNKTLQLDPNNNQLIYELGLLYYTMNDELSAIKYFELAVEKGYKADLDYYENLGLVYLDHDLNKGVQILNKVLESKPNNPEIMFQIAQAYYKAEKFQAAADTYFKVYQNDGTNSRALWMAGVSLQKKGDKGKGIAMCETALKMDPSLAQLKTEKFKF